MRDASSTTRSGWIVLWLVAGCGRVGFEERTADGVDPDAAPDSPGGSTRIQIGARPDADSSAVTDIVLSADEPAVNLGAHGDLHITTPGKDQSLIRFAVDGVIDRPIRSVQLHLWIFAFAPPAGVVITASEVLESWTEGAGDFESGVANFNDRLSGVPWTTPGAEAPGSRSPVIVSSAEVPTALDAEIVLDLPVDLVNRWVAQPESNHGLGLALTQPQYVELYSSNNPATERRPLLVVTVEP